MIACCWQMNAWDPVSSAMSRTSPRTAGSPWRERWISKGNCWSAISAKRPLRASAIWVLRRWVYSGVSGRALVSSSASLATRSRAWRMISKVM
jgi:hypothetical protein